ncbi:hypothetical protein HYV79_03130 [Candidatus Woesearchaeota archaeon]|nr:hypothetical protein [Candidatus Woesearchaeota archaeon]
MIIPKFALFISLLFLLGVAVKIPLPFKNKRVIRIIIVSITIFLLATTIDVPFLPQGAVTGLSIKNSEDSWVSSFLEQLGKYLKKEEAQTRIQIEQPLAEKQAQRQEEIVDKFMNEYNIPRERRQDFLNKAREFKEMPVQNNEPINKCFERVIKECN